MVFPMGELSMFTDVADMGCCSESPFLDDDVVVMMLWKKFHLWRFWPQQTHSLPLFFKNLSLKKFRGFFYLS